MSLLVKRTPLQPSGLTARQEEIHRLMLRYQADEHRPATHQELGVLMGVTNSNAVATHMKRLVQLGAVKQLGPGSRRYLAVPMPPPKGRGKRHPKA